MRTIFRLEHPDSGSKGPYTGPGIKGMHDFFDNRRHPCPDSDSGLSNAWKSLPDCTRRHYVFGFASFAQFKAWFYNDDVVISAYKAGYVVNVYKVADPAVLIGNAQAVFHDTYHTPLDICYTLNVEECLTTADSFNYTVITEANNLTWSSK